VAEIFPHTFAARRIDLTNHPVARSRSLLAFFLAMVMFALAGCEKKPLSTSEIRATTHEFVSAAQKAVGKQSEIAIRPQMQPGKKGQAALAADHIYITLRDPRDETALEQALDAVAASHDLIRGASLSSGGVREFDYARAGRITHTIHVVEPLAGTRAGPRSADLPSNAPKLAIIVDDLGRDVAPAREIFRLPAPLTISVIPNLPESAEIAEEAHQRGEQVMLHLPMEALGGDAPAEAVELRAGMNVQDAEGMVAAMLDSVPHAAGVNNHEGSKATADRALMDALMPALRRRGLFFVDSRTTVETVAYAEAQRDGVPAAFRSAQFLDDNPTREAILSQLDLAAAKARRNGWALTIGHPHPATIAALAEGLPRVEARGVRLVFVSDVVK